MNHRKTIEKIDEPKSWFSENIKKKMTKLFVRMIKPKREIKITKIRNERRTSILTL